MTAVRTDAWNRLVDGLYEAATAPEHWSGVLRRFAETFGAKSAVLRTVEMGHDRDVHATHHHNMYEPLQQAYHDGLVQQDPYLEVLQRIPPGRVVTNDNMIDLEAVRRTDFYHHYMRPLDNHYIVGGVLERHDSGAMSLIGLHRHSNAAPFDADTTAALRTLVPHLQRALWLQRTMEHQLHRARSAEAALDGIGVACFLLDRHGRLAHANQDAETLLREDPRFRLADGYLLAAGQGRGTSQSSTELLVNADKAPQVSARVMLLRSPDGRAPHLAALSAPVPAGANVASARLAIYVGDLDRTGVLDAGLMRQLYRLTAAEARLAVALGRGRELGDLARDWSVSRETLRTHLKRLLAKTGTTRQAELVRLLCGASWIQTV